MAWRSIDRLQIGDVVESRDIAHVLRAALAAAPRSARPPLLREESALRPLPCAHTARLARRAPRLPGASLCTGGARSLRASAAAAPCVSARMVSDAVFEVQVTARGPEHVPELDRPDAAGEHRGHRGERLWPRRWAARRYWSSAGRRSGSHSRHAPRATCSARGPGSANRGGTAPCSRERPHPAS